MFRKKCQKILAGLCALLLMGTGKSTVLVSSASEQKKNFGLEKPAEVQIPFAISVSGEEVPQSEFRVYIERAVESPNAPLPTPYIMDLHMDSGEEQFSFGKMQFLSEGEYHYRVRQEQRNHEGFTYDTTVYSVVIEVHSKNKDYNGNEVSPYLYAIVLAEKEGEEDKQDVISTGGDRSLMSLQGILDYANAVDLSLVRPSLQRQVEMNLAISQEGLDNPWGASVGKTILETWGSDVRACACARAAAGSDARMSGCPLPVVINSGSGNQGITVSMPVVEYAKALSISEEKMYRALIVSNLVSVYIKHYIGALSAFCGAVSASCGAGAGITYLCGGNYQKIGRTISNTLGNVGGIVCDGAKPSCAAKIASSVHAAILAHHMSMKDQGFHGGEGIVEEDVEKTIRNMGYIGKVGMQSTDREILKVMTDQVDVNSCV